MTIHVKKWGNSADQVKSLDWRAQGVDQGARGRCRNVRDSGQAGRAYGRRMSLRKRAAEGGSRYLSTSLDTNGSLGSSC